MRAHNGVEPSADGVLDGDHECEQKPELGARRWTSTEQELCARITTFGLSGERASCEVTDSDRAGREQWRVHGRRGASMLPRTAMANRPNTVSAHEPSKSGRRPMRSVSEAAETSPAN